MHQPGEALDGEEEVGDRVDADVRLIEVDVNLEDTLNIIVELLTIHDAIQSQKTNSFARYECTQFLAHSVHSYSDIARMTARTYFNFFTSRIKNYLQYRKQSGGQHHKTPHVDGHQLHRTPLDETAPPPEVICRTDSQQRKRWHLEAQLLEAVPQVVPLRRPDFE